MIDSSGNWVGTSIVKSMVAAGYSPVGGNVTLSGTGCSVTQSGQTINIAVSASGVTALNSLTGGLSIAASTGISVTPSGSTITIANTAPGVAYSGGKGVTISFGSISIGQAVGTGNAVTFAGILDSGGGIRTNKSSGQGFYSPYAYLQSHGVVSDLALSNLSIQSASGIACGYDSSSGFFTKTDPGGPHSGALLKVINGYDDGVGHEEGWFCGPGINIGTGPINFGAYYYFDGSSTYTGQSVTVSGSFVIGGTPYTNLIFKAGLLVS